jgi:hypothetical protein
MRYLNALLAAQTSRSLLNPLIFAVSGCFNIPLYRHFLRISWQVLPVQETIYFWKYPVIVSANVVKIREGHSVILCGL